MTRLLLSSEAPRLVGGELHWFLDDQWAAKTADSVCVLSRFILLSSWVKVFTTGTSVN